MGRIAGVPNKLTSEVKEKLQTLVEGVLDTLENHVELINRPLLIERLFHLSYLSTCTFIVLLKSINILRFH